MAFSSPRGKGNETCEMPSLPAQLCHGATRRVGGRQVGEGVRGWHPQQPQASMEAVGGDACLDGHTCAGAMVSVMVPVKQSCQGPSSHLVPLVS